MAGVEGIADADVSTSTVDDVRRRVQELRVKYCRCMEEITSSADRPSSEDLLGRCVLEIEGIKGTDLVDALRGHLEEELNAIDTEKVKLSEAMEDLTNSILTDSNALESKLEAVEFSMDLLAAQAFEEERDRAGDPWNLSNLDMSQNFEILELQSQNEKKEIILNSLQPIYADWTKYDIIEQIEDALSNVKIIDTFRNTIRLSLSTYVPKFGGSVVNAEDIADSLKMDHEMLIALGDGNVGLRSVEGGDTDYEELTAGTHKTIIIKGIVPQTSEELLRTAGSYRRDDIVPEESPLIAYVSGEVSADEMADAINQVATSAAAM